MSVSDNFIDVKYCIKDLNYGDHTTLQEAVIDVVNATDESDFVSKTFACKSYSNISIEARTGSSSAYSDGWYRVRQTSSAAWYRIFAYSGYTQVQADTSEGCVIHVSDNGVDFVDDTKNLIGKAIDIGDTWYTLDNAKVYLFLIGDLILSLVPYYYQSVEDGITYNYYYNQMLSVSKKTSGTWDWQLSSEMLPLLTGRLSSGKTGNIKLLANIDVNLPTTYFCIWGDYLGIGSLYLNLDLQHTGGYVFKNGLTIGRIYKVGVTNASELVTTKSIEDVIGTSDEPDDGLTGYDLNKVRDGGSDTIPIPDVSYINSVSVLGSLLKVYSITNSSLSVLAGELWSQSLIDQLYKTMTNPMSCIVNLRLQPISNSLASTSENLHIGNYVSAASGNRIDTNAYQLDLGSLKCYMFFDNYIDYAPYTKVSLYLPFVGVVPLDTNEVMNASLSVKYNVDMYSGTAVAYVHATRTQNGTTNNNLVGCYRCNLAFNVPLTSEVNNSLLNTFATFTNPSSYVNSVGTISNMATTQILNSPTVHKSSGLSSNVGYMGVMYPYLIVERPIDYSDSKCLQYQGYDTLKVTTLTSGFNKYKSGTIKVTDDTLTEPEIVELKEMLSNGVII